MKIYVVTKGCYSDYHIVAATLDKDVAEAIRAKFDGNGIWDEATIEEFEDAEIMLKSLWSVTFSPNGLLESVEDASDSEYNYENVNKCRTLKDGRVWVYISADTAGAAVKIAAEKRAEFLAQREGIS